MDYFGFWAGFGLFILCCWIGGGLNRLLHSHADKKDREETKRDEES
jgi:hypothetical protein